MRVHIVVVLGFVQGLLGKSDQESSWLLVGFECICARFIKQGNHFLGFFFCLLFCYFVLITCIIAHPALLESSMVTSVGLVSPLHWASVLISVASLTQQCKFVSFFV